jgi:Outer membrane protein (porin)
MKNIKTTVAILFLGTLAGTAYAQSSVTLYGIIDAGFLVNNNVGGSRLYALSQANSSRFGLKGAEDLGGGLQAIFDIENGFSSSTGALGQGGLIFGRKAYVGLNSATWGTLTAGRQYSVSNDFTSAFASGADWAASGLSYGTRAADVDNVDTTNRIQNAVKYETPIFGGFQFGGLYSLGGQAGSVTKNEVIDVSASYTNGPVKVGAGYTFVKDPYYATYGDQGNSSASATGTNDNINNKIYGGYASAGSQQIIVAGGSYALGPATIGVLYSNAQFGNLGTVAAGGAISAPKYSSGTATFNSGEVNVKYQLTPAVLLAGAYIYTHNSGAEGYGSAKYNQANLGVIYSLSKRTSLYAIGFYEIASGTDSTGHAAVANLYGSAYSKNDRQVSGIFGITHRF